MEHWVAISLVLLLCVFILVAGALWSYYKVRLCARIFRHDTITDEPLPSPAEETAAPPPLLCVDAPNAMRCCEGEYDLVVKDRCNQQPCWLKKDGSRLILSGSDGHWYIARHRNSDARDFTRVVRLICSQRPHDSIFPHKVVGGWAIKCHFRWRVDPSIAVQVPMAVLKEDPILGPEMLEIDRKDQSATACSKSLMCSIGNIAVKNEGFLQELFAQYGAGEAGIVYGPGNSDVSTAASSNRVETDLDTWVPCSATDSNAVFDAQFLSMTSTQRTSSDKVETTSAMSYQRTGLQYLAQTVAKAPHNMEECHVLRPGARPVDPPSQRQLPRRLPPLVLRVFVPSYQTLCSGLYVFVPNEQPNGHPLWRQCAPEPVHWLFCSSSGRWCIGGADVQRECFRRGAGFVAQTRPSGPDVFPHDCKTLWQQWDNNNKAFQEDSAIHVTAMDVTPLDPAKPRITISTHKLNQVVAADDNESSLPTLKRSCPGVADSPAQNQGLDKEINCKDNEVPPVIEVLSQHIPRVLVGEYVLVAAARPNDQPLWHKDDGDMWLYGAMDNRWYIADSSAKLLRFFCAMGEIYHAEQHLGRLPHQMQGCWECYKQGTWVNDTGMAVRAKWAVGPDDQDVLYC